MTEAELEAAAGVLGRRAGLHFEGSSRNRLRRCLERGAESAGEDVTAYVRRLLGDATEVQELVDRVTVQETSFFRDEAHFRALQEEILPALPEPVLVWCAACANGQEAYSVAMLLEESPLQDWRVLATDISSRARRRAETGVYAERELRGLSPARRDRHLVARPGGWEVRRELRDRVEVRAHNLATNPPPFPAGSCRLVLCRNVLIYLDGDTVRAFLRRLHDHLPPGAALLLGASESLWHIDDTFGLTRVGGAFVYRRPGPGATPARRPGPGAPAPAPPPVSPPPARAPAPRPAARPATPMPEADELVAQGEQESSQGDYHAAVRAFRQAAYIEPDHVLANAMLAMALEALGDAPGALRAYRAARGALQRADPAEVERELEGYSAEELRRLLHAKLDAA